MERGAPPAQDTSSTCPSSASPSSSQTSPPPPATRSGLGSGEGERDGGAERDRKEGDGCCRDRGWWEGGHSVWHRPQSSRALPRNPGRHSVPCCSLGEGEAGSTALARPPPPSASDTWSGRGWGQKKALGGEPAYREWGKRGSRTSPAGDPRTVRVEGWKERVLVSAWV